MITWPDLVIGGIALLLALKGWKRGFVTEIGGFIALAAATWAATRMLRRQGFFSGHERVVLFCTGMGLKYPAPRAAP